MQTIPLVGGGGGDPLALGDGSAEADLALPLLSVSSAPPTSACVSWVFPTTSTPTNHAVG